MRCDAIAARRDRGVEGGRAQGAAGRAHERHERGARPADPRGIGPSRSSPPTTWPTRRRRSSPRRMARIDRHDRKGSPIAAGARPASSSSPRVRCASMWTICCARSGLKTSTTLWRRGPRSDARSGNGAIDCPGFRGKRLAGSDPQGSRSGPRAGGSPREDPRPDRRLGSSPIPSASASNHEHPRQQEHQGHHAGHHRQDGPVPHPDVPRLRERQELLRRRRQSQEARRGFRGHPDLRDGARGEGRPRARPSP